MSVGTVNGEWSMMNGLTNIWEVEFEFATNTKTKSCTKKDILVPLSVFVP